MGSGFYVRLREPSSNRVGWEEKRWRIVRKRLPQNQHERNWGVCSHETRTITIHTPLSTEEFWATLWHEVIHATSPDLDESAVMRIEHGLLAASLKAGLFEESDE